MRSVERAAEEGDQVTVDFSGLLNGEPHEGTKGEGVEFVIGSRADDCRLR